MVIRTGARLALIAAMTLLALPARADRMALWNIVHGQCAAHAEAGQGPAPCERIDLAKGDDQGVALLKDRVGIAQFLAIPTRRVTGVEDPFVLDSAAPNYFAFAWAARDALAARLQRTLPRQDVSIAINSAFARSQDQLHLHLDCLDPDVAGRLAANLASLDDNWRPMAEPIKGRVYWARRVLSDDLSGVRPLNCWRTAFLTPRRIWTANR